MATYGRYYEVERFCEYLLKSTFDLSSVELIIVDQNEQINLEPIVCNYQKYFKIIHLRSNKLGLSYNRNIGLRVACGQIIAFPDDDCWYYSDTLTNVYQLMKDSHLVVVGMIFDRDENKYIFRKWRKKPFLFSRLYHVCYHSASFSMFIPHDYVVSMDENFGVGATYGSCEDIDFLLRVYNRGIPIKYQPTVVVAHPDIPPAIDKLYKYSIGWGALYRKHISFSMATLWIAVLFYHMLKLPMLIGKPNKFKNKFKFICGQIRGFVSYNEK